VRDRANPWDLAGLVAGPALVLALLASGGPGCGGRSRSALEEAGSEAWDPDRGRWASLDDPLFDKDIVDTGVWKPRRFHEVLGFRIYMLGPHEPGRIPVVFVHGLGSGPRVFEPMAAALDEERFEPWFVYYASGMAVEESASHLRATLDEARRTHDVDTVVLAGFSLGGLVVRAALAPHDDGANLPSVPVAFGLASPWGGVVQAGKWSWAPTAPPCWKSLKPDGPFLGHLFDDPLPDGTEMHLFYGEGGGSKTIDGPNDGVISVASATREEALAEAASVAAFPDLDHRGVIRDPQPVARVVEILFLAFETASE